MPRWHRLMPFAHFVLFPTKFPFFFAVAFVVHCRSSCSASLSSCSSARPRPHHLLRRCTPWRWAAGLRLLSCRWSSSPGPHLSTTWTAWTGFVSSPTLSSLPSSSLALKLPRPLPPLLPFLANFSFFLHARRSGNPPLGQGLSSFLSRHLMFLKEAIRPRAAAINRGAAIGMAKAKSAEQKSLVRTNSPTAV
jgi:hypothetical protein